MNKEILSEEKNTIAVYNGVLYVYHDNSWLEKESWRTDEELSNKQSWKEIVAREGEILNVRYLYKDTNELKSIPKLIITTSELPRVTSDGDALRQKMISSLLSRLNNVTKES